jgi:hypothetical protein
MALAKSCKKTYINTTIIEDLLIQLKMYAVSEGKRLNDILEEAIQDLLDRRIREAERTMEKTEKGDLSLAELELFKQQRKLKSQRVDAELKKKSIHLPRKQRSPKNNP